MTKWDEDLTEQPSDVVQPYFFMQVRQARKTYASVCIMLMVNGTSVAWFHNEKCAEFYERFKYVDARTIKASRYDHDQGEEGTQAIFQVHLTT